MEEAEAMDIDNSTIEEGLSRLKSIRQQKRFEAFLSTVEEDIKPVIDTSLNRNVTDESDFLSHSAKSHIERLTGEHAFVGYSFVCSLSHSLIHSFILSFSPFLLLSFSPSLTHLFIVEESESLSSTHAPHRCFKRGYPSAVFEDGQHDPSR